MKETYGYHRCNVDPTNWKGGEVNLETGEGLKPKKRWKKHRVDSGTQCPHCGTISRFVEP